MLGGFLWKRETKSARRDSACQELVSVIEAREDNRWTDSPASSVRDRRDSLANSVKDKSTLPWTNSSEAEVVNNRFASARYLCKYKGSDIELQTETSTLSRQPP